MYPNSMGSFWLINSPFEVYPSLMKHSKPTFSNSDFKYSNLINCLWSEASAPTPLIPVLILYSGLGLFPSGTAILRVPFLIRWS